MNLQDILEPVVDFFQWTFKHILVPNSPWFNWVCIAVGAGGMIVWLRMQNRFNKKAKREGGLA